MTPAVEAALVQATREILGKESQADVRVKVRFCERVLNLGRQMVHTLAAAQQVERRAVGEPDQIIGITPLAAGPPPTDEELAAEAAAVQRAVARLKPAQGGDDAGGNGVH